MNKGTMLAIALLVIGGLLSPLLGDPMKLDPVRALAAEGLVRTGLVASGDPEIVGHLDGQERLVLDRAMSDGTYACSILKGAMGPDYSCAGEAIVSVNWDERIVALDQKLDELLSSGGTIFPEDYIQHDVARVLLVINKKMAEDLRATIAMVENPTSVPASAVQQNTQAAVGIEQAAPTSEQLEAERRAALEQAARQREAEDYDYLEARSQKACIPGYAHSRTIGQTGVVCGCDYAHSAVSNDGRRVCAGGLYEHSAHSHDGSDVACGGRYQHSAVSRNGRRVCAGGLYEHSAQSNDGTDVACGGRYQHSAVSNDGRRVCAGGLYQHSALSNDGSDVACGGLYAHSATSRDGRLTCYGGLYGR